MFGSLRAQPFNTHHPNVRQIEPWRDGRQLAALLETAFTHDTIDASGHRMIDLLRNYGQFEPTTFGFGTSFVWADGTRLLGNASIQRNPSRKDVWIIGNVATDRCFRCRGIGQAVVEACLRYAAARQVKTVALQVDRDNGPAVRLYERLGFTAVGEVTYYIRPPVRRLALDALSVAHALPRDARRADRDAVLNLTALNLPPALSYAEPFDASVYRLGLRWSISNALNGNPERWFVLDGRDSSDALAGAVRTRVNIDGTHHHVELLLPVGASVDAAQALLIAGLQRIEPYISKPIYAAQSHTDSGVFAVVEAAYVALGFTAARNLIHMTLGLS